MAWRWLRHTHVNAVSTPSYSATTTPLSSSSLRLLVRQSSILPRTQTLAVLDGYSEVQIGRDAPPVGETTPRLRLKEMEVSKMHATVYWDKGRHEWAVVDMGSMHGTFHRSTRSLSAPSTPNSSLSTTHVPADGPGPSTLRADSRGTRLSPPRIASIPRTLAHGDFLSVGSTTFAIHIHVDGLPCVDCSSSESNEIPLFDHLRKQKRKRADSELIAPLPHLSTERDPKKAMTMLKRNLLLRREPVTTPLSSSAPAPYVDRSARRRALHTDAPEQPSLPRTKSSSSTPIAPPTLGPEPVSAPAAPLPSTNIGHRLLMKQGWQPGTGLGTSEAAGAERGSIALIEPLNIGGNVKRTGLGMSAPASARSATGGEVGLSRKEQAKLRRWENVRKVDAG